METNKHAGGRPPKFKTPEELQEKAEGYFHYCDVIIARWEKLTGFKAERLTNVGQPM